LAADIMAIREASNMIMRIGEITRTTLGLVVAVFALNWAVPAHAESCNAINWEEKSLTLRWDDQTVASCLSMLQSKAQEFKADGDPVEMAFRAVDDVCAQLEAKHISGDAATTAEKVCAELRAGTKTKPAQ
jgi:hypothetical protein